MLEGLMQHDFPLTLQHVRDRMRTLYADSEIVSVRDGERSSAAYGEVVQRADRLASGGASASGPVTGWPPSCGTRASTSRSTWPSRAWAPCSTPSTCACSPSSSPTSSTMPRTA